MVVTRSMARRSTQFQASDYERAAAMMRGQQARTNWWIDQLHTHGQTFARRHWPRQYKATDNSRRHRRPDSQPKTERVTGYTRRV